MADERDVKLPAGCDWKTLIEKSGTDLTDTYVDVLRKLGRRRDCWRLFCRLPSPGSQTREPEAAHRPDR